MSGETRAPFAQEGWDYACRFTGLWPARPESSRSIAWRIQQLARTLAEMEPAWGGLRPVMAMRAFRPSDPPPVLEMPVEELSEFLDKRARDGPPRAPQPVGDWGYSCAFHNEHPGHHPLSAGMIMFAGRRLPDQANKLELSFPVESSAWRSTARGEKLLWALVNSWDCAAAWAHAFGHEQKLEPGSWRPWLVWAKEPRVELPPQSWDDPSNNLAGYYDFPHETRRDRGGTLKIWS